MNILIVQCSFLGDMILSTPVIRAIAARHPNALLTLMTTPLAAPLMASDPDLSDVIVFDKRGSEKGLSGLIKKAVQLKARQFDRVYSLHRSSRTSMVLFFARIPKRVGFADASLSFLYTRQVKRLGKDHHAVLRNLSLVKDYSDSQVDAPGMKLFAPDRTRVCSAVLDEISKPEPFAVLAPGSAWETKKWHWQGFARLSSLLDAMAIRVVLIGGPDESDTCQKIADQGRAKDFSGALSLPETLFLMNRASLVVANDSMAMHMASATKRPTVAVFCSTTPALGFGPWDNPLSVIVEPEELDCRPCGDHGHHACPNGTRACMTMDAETVLAACKQVMTLGDGEHGSISAH